MANEDLAGLLQGGVPVASIEVDVSTSAMQPAAQGEGRRREVEAALRAAGADDDVVALLLAAVVQVPGAPDPVGVAAVAAGGAVVQASTPGSVPAQSRVDVAAVPDLSAVLRARERAVPVLAVEARAGGGVLRTYPVPGLAASAEQEVVGEDVAVHEAHAGGIAQSAHAHSAEDALAQNARLLAARVGELVQSSGIGTVVVLGDPRSAELLASELRRTGSLAVAVLGKDTAAAGSDPQDLAAAVLESSEGLLAAAHTELVDRLSANSFRLGAVGVDAVVTALQGAAVETLLVGPGAAGGELVALDGPPWVAESEDDALGAGVVGRFPAVAALIRAAVLTGASVRFPGAGVLPDDTPVAAHRWRPADDQEESRG